MNPLDTVNGTIIAGVILSILIGVLSMGAAFNVASLIVWIHVLSGITWIGLLYYFNFVQTPALAEAAADEGGPGGAGITPRTVVVPMGRFSHLALWRSLPRASWYSRGRFYADRD